MLAHLLKFRVIVRVSFGGEVVFAVIRGGCLVILASEPRSLHPHWLFDAARASSRAAFAIGLFQFSSGASITWIIRFAKSLDMSSAGACPPLARKLQNLLEQLPST